MNMHGSVQLFLSLAVIVLGSHVIILASMESIPEPLFIVASVAIVMAVFTLFYNIRKYLR